MFRECLRDLYACHHGFVRQACWRYVQNDEDADDLAHEVLIKAAHATPRFEGGCTTTTWLYRVAVNHCRDSVRRGRRRQAAHERFAVEPDQRMRTLGGTSPAWEDRESGWCGEADRPWVARLLEELRAAFDGPERHIAYLSFEVGLPQTVIARTIGLPRRSIARRLARIREHACGLYLQAQAEPLRVRA
jgi:RNA polymerase sigma factor (sigma-70 family)